ncbi:MAG: lytic transglycosylase domain-containing protein [Alphaproteobacteria bacterium]|nr:lytic transglycosylase domain-containing protein [Alphaproteobacteria bacterium]
MFKSALTTFLATTALLITAEASRATLLDSDVPIPTARPDTGSKLAQSAAPSRETTSSIQRPNNPNAISGTLKGGLDALSKGDITRARAIRDGMARNSLDLRILTWAIAISGAKGVPSLEIAAASHQLKGWPGLSALRRHSERALYREKAAPAQVVAAFGDTRPETSEGAIALTRALMATGEKQRAAGVMATLWRTKVLDKQTENLILKSYSGLLTKKDHKRRMDMLLYRDRVTQADRLDGLADAQSLFKARAAVIRKSSKAPARLKAVHSSWHDDPSYLFARIEYLRRNKKYKAAADLLLKAPRDANALINTREWWVEQRIVSRGLAEDGNLALAYKIAAHHVATRPVDVIEAEWHAGWFALLGFSDGKAAANHFQRVLDVATRPLSRSRAYYWLGRAAEAGGPGQASDYFSKAAAYSATYYGQLAAARIQKSGLQVRYPAPTQAERSQFTSREAVRAIRRLAEVGHENRATTLYIGLARELSNPGELAMLAAMAEKQGNHRLSLQVGKIAFGRGLDVAALAFPVGVIPSSANISGSGKALAYSIARQESAFDKAAISKADARGLLQLLPGTAKLVARKNGLAYSKAKLTRDAGYNATLGAHYLGDQITEFDGSYVLTFVAYNAGPGRAKEWLKRFGDPRGKPVDEVVDWVESIPFTETRNYVQRIMENYQVYKTRLGQKADIVGDLRFGRR